METGGDLRSLALLNMQYNRATYTNNIEEKTEDTAAPPDIYHNIIFGVSGNYYFIQSRGQQCYIVKSPIPYSFPCSSESHSDTRC